MTANVETATIAYLLGDSAIGALINTRVYPLARPQGSALPAITLTRISGGPLYADDGEVGLLDARLQIDSYAVTYTAGKELGGAGAHRLLAGGRPGPRTPGGAGEGNRTKWRADRCH